MKKPNRIVVFLAASLLLYLTWYATYELWLAPDQRLDQWLNTRAAEGGSALLRLVGFEAGVSRGNYVLIDGRSVVIVGNPCNGLELFALFAGFVLVYPGPWRRKAWFIPLGILVIHGVNLIRVAVLALNYKYSHHTFAFNHKYVFTTLVYALIFGLWVWWVNRLASPVPPVERAVRA